MAAIRGGNTKPEIWLRRRLHRLGYRYRVGDKRFPGRPDIVLPKYKKVVFVQGCYWHRHDCPMFVLPKTRTEFWEAKLGGNRVRDQRVRRQLLISGWLSLVVWECAIRGRLRLPEAQLLNLVTNWLEEGYADADITGVY